MRNKAIAIIIVVLILIFGLIYWKYSQREESNSNTNDQDKISKIRIETICTDGIDNDGDALIDNEDGDCWSREGLIYQTHPYFYSNHSFKEITQQIPQLANLGVKTLYLMPIWKHLGGKKSIYATYDYFRLTQSTELLKS